MFLKVFGCIVVENILFLLAFSKKLRNSDFYGSSLQGAFRKPHLSLKIAPEAATDVKTLLQINLRRGFGYYFHNPRRLTE
jgi:hypothetical protein